MACRSRAETCLCCKTTQRHKLETDPLVDLRKVRARTARTFLDGFAKIQQGQGKLCLPIFAAMSPTDKVIDCRDIVMISRYFMGMTRCISANNIPSQHASSSTSGVSQRVHWRTEIWVALTLCRCANTARCKGSCLRWARKEGTWSSSASRADITSCCWVLSAI